METSKALIILVDPLIVNIKDLLSIKDSRLFGAAVVRVRRTYWGQIDPPLQIWTSIEKMMKFNSIQDLKDWINENDLRIGGKDGKSS